MESERQLVTKMHTCVFGGLSLLWNACPEVGSHVIVGSFLAPHLMRSPSPLRRYFLGFGFAVGHKCFNFGPTNFGTSTSTLLMWPPGRRWLGTGWVWSKHYNTLSWFVVYRFTRFRCQRKWSKREYGYNNDVCDSTFHKPKSVFNNVVKKLKAVPIQFGELWLKEQCP